MLSVTAVRLGGPLSHDGEIRWTDNLWADPSSNENLRVWHNSGAFRLRGACDTSGTNWEPLGIRVLCENKKEVEGLLERRSGFVSRGKTQQGCETGHEQCQQIG